ncbi:response regulator [Caulobacter sp. 17J80-11]|uniref:response regulator n=1 Tax=Caulobacter sp. 17J80-11 TaxID=2763502 RepID=UPI001653E1C2|nr:response regulator [Caulobacter sp. 17J80-11]MBC6983378.1 response regulator [Caulobacter sp. 17J80-11]
MEAQGVLRVLVVDDDALVGMITQEVLEDLGCRAVRVEGADSALELLEAATFDLLLSDIRMPGINGVELARRAQARHPHLPIVLCTGDAASWSAELCGAPWAVLEKPFTPAQLAATIAGAALGVDAGTARAAMAA